MANAVTLTGEIAEIEALRHTPAGVPLVHFRLAHRSLQMEAGLKRQAECEVSAVALGETANALARMRAGSRVRVAGFLNRKNRLSAQLVLHVTKTEPMTEDTDHGNGTEQG